MTYDPRALLASVAVVYQPVVDLQTGVVVALEALVRFRDTVTGALLRPDPYLPALEASGDIVLLDRQVARMAVAQLATWRAARPGRPLSMAVNVSVCGLDDPRLPRRLAALSTRYGVPLNALIVEITESTASVDGQGHEQVLEELVAAGVNVSLDDFGTGFSSLSHLQRFPVCGVKVDRSFVTQLTTGGRGAAVARALIGLGQELGVHVVAEGVEHTAQLTALRALGCPYGQGYLFSPGVPARQADALLDRVFDISVADPACVVVGVPAQRSGRSLQAC